MGIFGEVIILLLYSVISNNHCNIFNIFSPNQIFGWSLTIIVLLPVAWTEVTSGIQLVNRLF